MILPNAGATAVTSTFVNCAIAAGLNNVVTTKNPTSPANAAAPSLSFDIPYATPTANNIGILSIIEAPALINSAATGLFAPHPTGSIQ